MDRRIVTTHVPGDLVKRLDEQSRVWLYELSTESNIDTSTSVSEQEILLVIGLGTVPDTDEQRTQLLYVIGARLGWIYPEDVIPVDSLPPSDE